MSEDTSNATNTNTKGKGIKREKQTAGGIALDRSLLDASRPKRQRKAVKESVAEEEVRWSTAEKEKLLDALYRYSHTAFESISQFIKTKSPKEVEQFIHKMMNSSCLNYNKRVVELDPEKGAAPLELWMSLVQELVTTDKKIDHSRHYIKIMNVIGQNEPMAEDSGVPGLKWRRLYQFFSDLLDDKAVLQPISSIESLVMLDMMHSMGDTLHASDTKEQRRLLDLKYQLFKWQVQHPKEHAFTASYSAIDNDYSRAEYSVNQPDVSFTTAQGGSDGGIRSSPTTSTSAAAFTSYTLTSTSLPSSSLSSSQPHPSSSSSQYQSDPDPQPASQLSTASSTSINETATTTMPENSSDIVDTTTTTIPPASTSTSTPSSSSSSSSSIPTTNDTTGISISTTKNNTNSTSPGPRKISNLNSNNKVEKEGEEEEENEELLDPLPKLFSLNPLTIPPHLLTLRPKIISTETTEFPIVLE